MEDGGGGDGGEAGEGEQNGGEVAEDSQLVGVPVSQGARDVKYEAEVGEVIALALRLHLVTPAADDLIGNSKD